jgi:DNA-binding NarL/FixJ family response regulator
VRARDADGEELTPSELQVALRVADGLTNREVGAVLFLSPKTVEHHLSVIYRKLGIRSRTELARRMATDTVLA